VKPSGASASICEWREPSEAVPQHGRDEVPYLTGDAAAADAVLIDVLLDEALRLATEAVDLARSADDLDKRGRALIDLAEVLQLAGRSQESVPVLREAMDTFERKGNRRTDEDRARSAPRPHTVMTIFPRA
jgi:hypothetical protein